MKEEDLDTLFAAARAAPPAPSDALTARVMADALAHQPAPRPAPAARPPVAPHPAAPPRRRPFWEPLAAIFGGTGALVGMGGAAVTGLVIGLAQPAAILTISEAYLFGTTDSVALLPSVDTLFSEVME